MIYDCFMFFNEFDLLEIRLNELDDVVDKFVIVEANKTHSGISKEYFFRKNFKRYEKFLEKIICISVETPDAYTDAWDREFFQRNQIMQGLLDCTEDDIIILSDLDEIPDKKILTKKKLGSLDQDSFLQLHQAMRYYYLNCDVRGGWNGSTIVSYSIFKKPYTSPQLFRRLRNLSLVRDDIAGMMVMNGGWHFSYLGPVEEIQLKLKSFAHTEYSGEEYTNTEKVLRCVEQGLSIFDENHKFKFIPVAECYLPDYVKNNLDLFKKYIK